MYVIRQQETWTSRRNEVGGKADNLFRIKAAGHPVPNFIAISQHAFWDFVHSDSHLKNSISKLRTGVELGIDQTLQLAEKIRGDIQSQPITPAILQSLTDGLSASFSNTVSLAVRSSMVNEDGIENSFAGMHDSFLFVNGLANVLDRVKQVWASAFHERAIIYRQKFGLHVSTSGVGVIIQEMCDPISSGVIFTSNPTNQRVDQMVISSVWGIGEGLVSGQLPADAFVVPKQGAPIDSTVVPKLEKRVRDTLKDGLTTIPVPREQVDIPSLNDCQLKQLALIGKSIEVQFGRPQDIEFCFEESGQLKILQTRPVTNVAELGPAAGNRLIWDNSNIIESYAGVTTPLTFSFIRRAYTIVYHCFAEVMGISPKKVQESRHVFENMLGMIEGRVYYNLENWYRLIRLFPGFQYNAPFMESMMGLRESLDIESPDEPPGFWRRWFIELPALLRLLSRTGWNFMRIRTLTRKFEFHFQENYQRWDAIDFRQLAPHELKQLYHEMEDSLLWNWKAPIINDFYVMIYYGLLKRMCQTWIGDESNALQNDLICGEGGVESAKPAKRLLRMANTANHNHALKQLILQCPIEQLPEAIASNPDFSDFQDMMVEYLQEYGFRCMNELKLEERSLRDQPARVYQVLRNYLSLADPSVLDVDAMAANEKAIRTRAESRVSAAMKSLWFYQRLIFQRILSNARTGVKNRENMRFARTRIYGVVRELFRVMGEKMSQESILADSEDIFYLTIDEVWDFIQGTSVCPDLTGLVDVRRRTFEQFRANDIPPADRFETYGFVYHKNRYQNSKAAPSTAGPGQLQGTGCCPGVVSERVRVLQSPQGELNLSGEILVAERTDPGWVPLYPAVSGILIERGSVLSHSAVVAREMGIPTIVGITGLLKHVKDGDYLTMNGTNGIVDLGSKTTQV